MGSADISDADAFAAAEAAYREMMAPHTRRLTSVDIKTLHHGLALTAEAVRLLRFGHGKTRRDSDRRSAVLHALALADAVATRTAGEMTGSQVETVQRGLRAADVWLGQVNGKGLTRGQRIRVDTARQAASIALAVLAGGGPTE